jgi:hypothetical protein
MVNDHKNQSEHSSNSLWDINLVKYGLLVGGAATIGFIVYKLWNKSATKPVIGGSIPATAISTDTVANSTADSNKYNATSKKVTGTNGRTGKSVANIVQAEKSPTKGSTGWSLFENELIKFQYPKEIKEIIPAVDNLSGLPLFVLQGIEELELTIVLQPASLVPLPLPEFLNSSFAWAGMTVESIKPDTINSYESASCVATHPQMERRLYVVAIRNNVVLALVQLAHNETGEKYSQYTDMVNQIVKSIQFPEIPQ